MPALQGISTTQWTQIQFLPGKILPSLDAATPEQVAARFAELRAQFDGEAAGASNENGWKALRDTWLGRKSGLITQVTDIWLKPSKTELKRAVGQALNELKAHVEAALQSRRVAIEAAAESAASAREREDLSLPGVMRALGLAASATADLRGN